MQAPEMAMAAVAVVVLLLFFGITRSVWRASAVIDRENARAAESRARLAARLREAENPARPARRRRA